jgi:hypothetical protein
MNDQTVASDRVFGWKQIPKRAPLASPYLAQCDCEVDIHAVKADCGARIEPTVILNLASKRRMRSWVAWRVLRFAFWLGRFDLVDYGHLVRPTLNEKQPALFDASSMMPGPEYEPPTCCPTPMG